MLYLHTSPNDFPDLLDSVSTKEEVFLEASITLAYTALRTMYDGLGWGMLSAFFSWFSLSGIPVCEVSTVFNSPPIMPWRPAKLMRPPWKLLGCNSVSFFLAVTQRRNLAKLTNLSAREAEVWLSVTSMDFFEGMKELMGKVTHGKACPEEKKSLRASLVVLLFASEVRTTYVLHAAQKVIYEINLERRGEWVEFLTDTIFIVIEYILKSSDQRNHLRLWTQHWLRKLYGSSNYLAEMKWVLIFLTLLFSMDLGPDPQLGCDVGENETGSVKNNDPVEDDMEEDDVEEDDVEEDVHPPLHEICHLLTSIAKLDKRKSLDVELSEKLDILACNDFADMFYSPLPLSVRSDKKHLKMGAIMRYTKGVAASEYRRPKYFVNKKFADKDQRNEEELVLLYLFSCWIS